MSTAPLEIRKDVAGEKFYASRNYGDFRHTYADPRANRAQLDWTITLRQVRKKPGKKDQSASAPNLHTAELQRDRLPLTDEHEEGPYYTENEDTIGKYQNFASSHHMINKLGRVSSVTAPGIDWQLNLRNGLHQQPDPKGSWRRYFSRPQASFDMMAENCAADNADYKTSIITPQDRRPDRRTGAIAISTIRDDPMSFKRWPGCEGTHVGQWRHLIDDHRYGRKPKRQLRHEVTLREDPKDPNPCRINDNRSDGCIVEMMGRKRWYDSNHWNPRAARPPEGDPKLHHVSRTRIMPEADEENRKKRMSKQKRLDEGIGEEHPAVTKKREMEADD
mmetsp:Transcript_126526/g.236530  ORF Transcript_126526/g.236530 Transcript_126526/m.236530 type:complete len:333 (-) Transcript_126526:196-1194(-)